MQLVSPAERSQSFVIEGDEALEKGNYEEAVNKYRAAYYGLSAAERTSYLGSIPVRKAMRAYDLLLAEKQDRSVLERQIGFVTEFLTSVEEQEGGAERVGDAVMDELRRARDEAQRKLSAMSQALAPTEKDDEPSGVDDGDSSAPVSEGTDEEKVVDTGPTVGELTVPPPVEDKDPPKETNWLGVGLSIGGGATMLAGAGVSIGWWSIRRQAETFADETPGYEEGTPTRVEYLAGEETRARRFLVAGGVVFGVGAAVLTAGVVHILVQRRRRRNVAVLPHSLAGEGMGMSLVGRF